MQKTINRTGKNADITGKESVKMCLTERSGPMEIEWYWLAEKLGLIKNVTAEYADGSTYYEVAVKGAERFFTALAWSMIPLFFLLGLITCMLAVWKNRQNAGKTVLRCGIVVLLLYAVLLAVGIGPYIEFYPRGGGFIDLSVLEHMAEGVYCAILALCLFLGGKLGQFFGKRMVLN